MLDVGYLSHGVEDKDQDHDIFPDPLKILHKKLSALLIILNDLEYPSHDPDDLPHLCEFKSDVRQGIARMKQDFDLYLNRHLYKLDEIYGGCDD